MPGSARLLPVAAALCLVLDPVAAAATSALFHFDDFDYSGPYEGPEFDAPYTYLYGCEGKPYCTGRDIVRTNGDGDDDPATPVSTVRNGIGMVIDRYGYTMTLNYDADSGWADVGNSPQDFTLFPARLRHSVTQLRRTYRAAPGHRAGLL